LNNYEFHDQDIINIACFGFIKIFPLKYNAFLSDIFNDKPMYYSKEVYTFCYDEVEWNEAKAQPHIIHFATDVKPWSNLGINKAELWWDYFFKCYANNFVMLSNFMQSVIENTLKTKPTTQSNTIKKKLKQFIHKIDRKDYMITLYRRYQR
jgi:lipopolysaccharide biosynthesis glycosyltransferase